MGNEELDVSLDMASPQLVQMGDDSDHLQTSDEED